MEIATVDKTWIPSYESKQSLIEVLVSLQTNQNIKSYRQFWDELNRILNQLVTSQEEHTKVHAKMMSQCLEENSFREKEVQQAKDAFKRANYAYASCKKSRVQAEKELPQLQNTLSNYFKELNRARKQREDERKKFEERRRAFNEAIAFLNDFIKFVKEKLKGHFKAFSLVEFSEKLLIHSSKLNVSKSAMPILVAIAEATFTTEPRASDYEYKPNEALGQKLKNLLTDLLNRLVADNAANERDEKKAVEVFTAYEKRLVTVISTLEKNVRRVKKQIIDMMECENKESLIIKNALSKESRNASLQLQAKNMCNDFNNEYISATLARRDEISTMRVIIEIVNKRFKQVPKDLQDYLKNTEKGFFAYINSTAFKKFEEYKRKQFSTNDTAVDLLKEKNLLK
jgi:hypothetical protein